MWALLGGVGVLAGVLLWADAHQTGTPRTTLLQSGLVLAKLVAAAAIGLVVTGVARRTDKPLKPAMEHAQVLLCVAGALMMMLIGDSLARAFGIVGAASMVRFRTPVKDPKAVTVLFLLLGLGMAAGLGAFPLAALGAGFLCLFLVLIGHATPPVSRILTLTLPSGASTEDVEGILAGAGATFEPRDGTRRDGELVLRYLVTFDRALSLKAVNEALLDVRASPVRALAWESVKAG